jgi:hypothetical protein
VFPAETNATIWWEKLAADFPSLASSFCHQVAALVPGMFCNFYSVKNHKIANNLTPTEDREKTPFWNPYHFRNFL